MIAVLATEAGGAHGEFAWSAVIIGLILLGLNAFFVAAEIALLAARQGRIEERAEAGDVRATIALGALKELSVTFSGAQLGITMCSLGLGAIAEPALASVIEGWLGSAGLPNGASTALGFAVGLGIVVFLHMVVGEMVPKNLALASPEDVALRLARPFRLFVVILRPLILVLNGMGNLMVRAVGVEPRDEGGLVHTPAELALVVWESRLHGTVEAQDARVMSAALALGDIDAEGAMTPRVDLVTLPDVATGADVLAAAAVTGFTRFPVHHADLDDIVGLVHVKDVLIRDDVAAEDLLVSDLLRPIGAVPESRSLEDLLADMRRDRSHALLVVDEYGGTAGLVTLEDVLEELVGEIADEFDGDELGARNRGHGKWTVQGTYRHDELQRLTGLVIADSDSETVSGWLTEQVGRLLVAGDVVQRDGFTLKVQSLEGRRAGRVEIELEAPDAT